MKWRGVTTSNATLFLFAMKVRDLVKRGVKLGKEELESLVNEWFKS